MADKEQISLLKQGVTIWNEWINNSGVVIDLSNDDFRHVNLANAYLEGANLIGTKLSGAELSDNGKLVFVSYWDSSFIALDLTNPAQPVFKGRTVYPAYADGAAPPPPMVMSVSCSSAPMRIPARPVKASKRGGVICASGTIPTSRGEGGSSSRNYVLR